MVGQKLGHYKILALLGKGGMGEVYRAEDPTLDREVAIKLLLPEVSDDPKRLSRWSGHGIRPFWSWSWWKAKRWPMQSGMAPYLSGKPSPCSAR